MKLAHFKYALIALIFLLSSCTHTFFGTVMILNFRDVILYVFIALILSVIVSFFAKGDKRTAFWISFILSLLLTPLVGLIYLLILFTRKPK